MHQQPTITDCTHNSEQIQQQDTVINYRFRQRVQPGITGLAQVTGLEGGAANLQHLHNRVIVDNFYIRHRLVRLHLIMLLCTMCNITGLFKYRFT